MVHTPVAPHPVRTPKKETLRDSSSCHDMKGFSSPCFPTPMKPPPHLIQNPRASLPFNNFGVSAITLSGSSLFLRIEDFVFPQPPRNICFKK